MAPFSEELVVSAAGVPLPLAVLTGACTAGELALASDSLPFGTVALGSRTSKRLALSNTGDVGARFAWDTRALAPHFSIQPPGAPRGRRGRYARRGAGALAGEPLRPRPRRVRGAHYARPRRAQRASWRRGRS